MYTLQTKEARYWKFKATLILKTETLVFRRNQMDSTNIGILSMLTSGKENQVKENSMKSSDFTSKEISMLFHNYLKTDILI
jgi:hypothetical protein